MESELEPIRLHLYTRTQIAVVTFYSYLFVIPLVFKSLLVQLIFFYEMFMPYAMDTYIAIANIEYASVDLTYNVI